MKKILITLFIGFVLYSFFNNNSSVVDSLQQIADSDQQIVSAFQNRISDVQVSGHGIVLRNLADDTKGSRHQKFILQLASGQTLLVAHNIDLAPRIDSLKERDTVAFYGEYEWNAKGGVLHWTHHDPNGRHEDGWLLHDGLFYR